MKRIELINRLIREGISEKTLVNFTDRQINNLAERLLGEATTSTVKNTVYSPSEVSAAKQKGQGFGVKDGTVTLSNDGAITVSTKEGQQDMAETLKGNQKKIDKNHNGVIDAQDFKILKGQKKKTDKKKDTNELLRFYDDDGNPIKDKKGKQSAVSTKDKDFKEKTKSKNIDSKDKKTTSKKSEKTCDDCGKAISKCTCDHSHLDETTNWVKGLVENKYFHNFTSKNEIMELIKTKLNEEEVAEKNALPDFLTSKAIKSTMKRSGAPTTKPRPTTKPGTSPGTKPKHDPLNPGVQPSPGPQAESAPTTKPKPTTKPDTKPGTKPKHDPLNPGIQPNPRPQAKKKK